MQGIHRRNDKARNAEKRKGIRKSVKRRIDMKYITENGEFTTDNLEEYYKRRKGFEDTGMTLRERNEKRQV